MCLMNKMMEDIRNAFERARNTDGFTKFVVVLCIMVIYFLYISYKIGVTNGIGVTLLTWGFFLFGTPYTDAGVIIDFPVNAFMDIPFELTEIYIFIVGTYVISYFYFFDKSVFRHTFITRMLYKAMTHPFGKYGLLMFLAFMGTILSAYVENGVYDWVMYNRWDDSERMWGAIIALVVVWIAYFYMIHILRIADKIIRL